MAGTIEDTFRSILNSEILKEAVNKGIMISSQEDKYIWDCSYSGMFTLSTSWELVRKRGLNSLIAKCCWHKNIALKISLFLWKMLHNAIPTDLAVSKKGINLPSKCLCCNSYPSVEYNNHIFLSSETALSVWTFYANLVNVNMESKLFDTCFLNGGQIQKVFHYMLGFWEYFHA